MALEVWDAQRDIKNLFITPEIRARIMRFDAHELSAGHTHDLGHEMFLVLDGNLHQTWTFSLWYHHPTKGRSKATSRECGSWAGHYAPCAAVVRGVTATAADGLRFRAGDDAVGSPQYGCARGLEVATDCRHRRPKRGRSQTNQSSAAMPMAWQTAFAPKSASSSIRRRCAPSRSGFARAFALALSSGSEDHTTVTAMLGEVLRRMLDAVRTQPGEAVRVLGLQLPEVPAEIPTVHFAEARQLIEPKRASGSRASPTSHRRTSAAWAAGPSCPGSEFLLWLVSPWPSGPSTPTPQPDQPAYSNSFDLLFRGLELVTAGQRLHGCTSSTSCRNWSSTSCRSCSSVASRPRWQLDWSEPRRSSAAC
jgi:hypothetical protein